MTSTIYDPIAFDGGDSACCYQRPIFVTYDFEAQASFCGQYLDSSTSFVACLNRGQALWLVSFSPGRRNYICSSLIRAHSNLNHLPSDRRVSLFASDVGS